MREEQLFEARLNGLRQGATEPLREYLLRAESIAQEYYEEKGLTTNPADLIAWASWKSDRLLTQFLSGLNSDPSVVSLRQRRFCTWDKFERAAELVAVPLDPSYAAVACLLAAVPVPRVDAGEGYPIDY